MSAKPLLAGIELGGTKCIALVGTGPDDIRWQTVVPTGDDPEATLRKLQTALTEAIVAHGPIAALGIASFGPLDLVRQSPTYGHITTTAKTGWRDAPIVARIANAFSVPVVFDTDVNGAALAEGCWGAARNLGDFAYVTVGTGVGVGLIVGGRPISGFTHAELGHIRIVRRPGDTFVGACPYHGDCVEGLASGAAVARSAGRPASDVPDGDPVWERVAHALGQLLHTLVLAAAPRRILIGGGVMAARPALLPRIRAHVLESLNGYVDLAQRPGGMDAYVVGPGLGDRAGPLGALALAAHAL